MEPHLRLYVNQLQILDHKMFPIKSLQLLKYLPWIPVWTSTDAIKINYYQFIYQLCFLSYNYTACHEIFTNDRAELAEIIGSHGSARQWCTYLMISESTCNCLDYSRQHQDDIVLDVAKAFLNEKLNPCWEDIVHVLCKSLKKNKPALKLSEKHSVSYSSQCG